MAAVQVLIDPSQFPERVREDLHRSLSSRRIAPKFHYDSYKQTCAWLRLHEALSPARRDPGCKSIYEQAADHLAANLRGAHVIGLGCGSGQKDALLFRKLRSQGHKVHYTPVDVSVPMTLVAAERARQLDVAASPAVCDLATVEDLEALVRGPASLPRVVTFFGMLPNIDAAQVLPKVAGLLRPDDTLLLSANLAPGPDYQEGLRAVLPQYDNPLTADWLMLFLSDLGFARDDGALRWTIEPAAAGFPVCGFVARFEPRRPRAVSVDDRTYKFEPGDRIRLFASWRHTPQWVAHELAQVGLGISRQWVAPSGEEGVFQVFRNGQRT